MRDNLKLYGIESLYMLGVCIMASLAALLQFVGRQYQGDYSGFIFSGSGYRYNFFFYLLGLAVFLCALILPYKFFLKQKITALRDNGIAPRIIWIVIAVIFSILMLIAILFGMFLIVGINDNLRPLWLLNLTGFGWPVINLLFMIYIATVSGKLAD